MCNKTERLHGDIQPAAGPLSISLRFCVTRRWVHEAAVPREDHTAGNPCTTLSFGFPFGAGDRSFYRILRNPWPFATRILIG